MNETRSEASVNLVKSVCCEVKRSYPLLVIGPILVCPLV